MQQKNSFPAPNPRLCDEEYFSSDGLCQYLDISPRTLIRWRDGGFGPPCTSVGRCLYFRRTAVTEWLRSRERNGLSRPAQCKPVKPVHHTGPTAPRLSRTRNARREARSRA